MPEEWGCPDHPESPTAYHITLGRICRTCGQRIQLLQARY